MTVVVENLEKLERKMTLTMPVAAIQGEVDVRLRKLARTVKMDGFRPGKVPMNVVAQRYGYSVQYEVVNDKVGQAFSAAANEAKLRVAGHPSITQATAASDDEMAFDSAAQETDRVTVDFEGKIDGELFDGGKAADFQFVLGDGQMLKEFEAATQGMKIGESKTFPLVFPEDYQGKDVAGKTADFMVTLKKLEAAHLPAVDDAMAKSLGIPDGTVEAMRADIRKNLQREVKFRLLNRNKQAAMDALVSRTDFDLPRSSVMAEVDRMVANAREELKQRGVKDADKAPIPQEMFLAQAERRVRLGLTVAELVRTHNLEAKPEHIKQHVDELASSYEKPAEVVRWYYSDRQRMAEVESVVIENNVTDYILSQVKVEEKHIDFDELMGQV